MNRGREPAEGVRRNPERSVRRDLENKGISSRSQATTRGSSRRGPPARDPLHLPAFSASGSGSSPRMNRRGGIIAARAAEEDSPDNSQETQGDIDLPPSAASGTRSRDTTVTPPRGRISRGSDPRLVSQILTSSGSNPDH
eukprot:GHVU01100135.1.p1 GENE.GHVU01100135.1~~GHVU01100135.1.p1  ORF type:complete len:140 (+),score=1.68 GHVU01100135.1:1102-1521(+)